MDNKDEKIDYLKDVISQLQDRIDDLKDELYEKNNKEYDLSDFINCYYDDLKLSKYNNEWVYIWDFEYKKIYILLK